MRIGNIFLKVFGGFVNILSDAEWRHHLSQLSSLMLGVFLIVHATFRGAHSDLDAHRYIEWYESLRDLSWRGFFEGASAGIYFDSRTSFRFELGFASIAFICVKLGFSLEAFFFVCATASILPKVLAISRYSLSPLSTLTWYVSWYYVLFEMNAIRVGIANAVLIMGLRHILSGNLLRFAPFVVIGSLFHVSAIVGLLLILVVRLIKIDARFIALMLAGSVILSFVPMAVVFEPLGRLNDKIRDYFVLLQQQKTYSTINVFNAITLLRMAILCALLYTLSHIRWSNIEQLGLWAMGISLALYFSLASFPVVAGRLSQLIGMFQIFVTPVLLRGFKPKFIPRFFFILLIVAQFYAVVFYSRLADFFYFTNITWLRFPLAIQP
jgi:hypothetical protein